MKRIFKSPSSTNHGFSLVELMIGVAIMGFLAVGFAKYMKNSFESQKHLEIRGDLDNLKRNLQQNLSCEASLPAGPCVDDTWISLKNKKGGVIVPSNTTKGAKIGEWSVRAFCKDFVLKIQYAKLNSSGTAVSDPLLKNKILDWKDLYPEGLEKCIAEGRSSYAAISVGSYNYITAANVGSTNQTVTISFQSTGFSMAAGGFLRDINGWTSPGGAVASDGVTCSSSNFCSITKILAPGRSMRAGTRATCVTCAPYQGLLAVTTSSTDVGLLGTVKVAESAGAIVASTLSWWDYDISPTHYYDTSAAGLFNGGNPF
jgi:prepilin-type N-terminal cleavage/methylation domain-containing protein